MERLLVLGPSFYRCLAGNLNDDVSDVVSLARASHRHQLKLKFSHTTIKTSPGVDVDDASYWSWSFVCTRSLRNYTGPIT